MKKLAIYFIVATAVLYIIAACAVALLSTFKNIIQ